MSKTIDQRVVEMRFDNAHFEKNVSTTMSTLDKLKEKLNFSKSAKGLEDINTAANKVNMNGLSAGIQTIQTKFSALQVAGITCMTRITNAAITAGKNIVNALTIQPITTGFSEYELKMGSIQTIMASTGESLETVNRYLNELNEYSDKTIYSFSDMTQNIGKFTNAGVKLEDAVAAIQGISNEAALSGANAGEASRAMYNFAQALSAGYVKLIDWKSIENANMATVGFKEQLIETAVKMGTLTKTASGFKTAAGTVITATKNFNDSLQDQWMTSDVLITTLKKYSDTTTDIGKKATQAATEVKTYSQMMDSLKESAQSGWAQTWEIIFGDFEEGKTLWTSIYNSVDKVLGKINDTRNSFLKFNLGSSWEQVAEEIEGAGITMEDFQKALAKTAKKHGKDLNKMIKKEKSLTNVIKKGLITKEEVVETLEDYSKTAETNSKSQEDLNEKLEYFQKVVDQVWNGDYKNGKERIEALTKAGYDYNKVQDLVNKTVDGHRLTLADLSDEQLESVGYTKEQIKAIKELAKQAKDADQPLSQLLDRLTKPSGRELLIDAFKNIGEEIGKITGAVSDAWNTVFKNEKDPSQGFSLYTAIEEFKKFTDEITLSEDGITRFKNILGGIFSTVDLTWSIASASTLGFLKIINEVLNILGVKPKEGSYAIVDFIEYIALKLSDFNKWVEDKSMFGSDTKWKDIANVIAEFILGIKSCIDAFLGLKPVKTLLESIEKAFTNAFNVENFKAFFDFFNQGSIIDNIKNLFNGIVNWIKGIDKAVDIGKYIIDGLVTGLVDNAYKVGKAIYDLATGLITAFCNVLGIESPSTVFITLGSFIVAGLVKGLEQNFGWAWDIIKSLGNGLARAFEGVAQNGVPYIIDAIKILAKAFMKGLENIRSIDFGSLFIMAGFTSFVFMFSKLVKAIEKFANPLEKLSDMIESAKGVFDQLKNTIESIGKAKSMELKSKALLNLAIALAILVAAFAALCYIKTDNLWTAVGVLTFLSAILIGLAFAMKELSDSSVEINKQGVKVGGFKTGLLAIVGSLAVLALIVKIIGNMDPEQAKLGFIGLAGMAAGLTILMAAYGKLIKGDAAQNIDKAGIMMMKMAGALIIMSFAVKLIAGISWPDLGKAGIGILGFVGIAYLLNSIGKIPSTNIDKLGSTMLKISGALLIMVVVVKIINTISWEEMTKAGVGIVGFIAVVGLLALVDTLFKGTISSVSKTLASIAGAMVMLAIAGKVMATMSWEEMTKAVVGLSGLVIVITLLTKITQIAYKDAPKIGVCLLALSIALGILAGVAVLLGMIDPEHLWQGVAAMGALAAMMTAMIWATRGANDVKGNLIAMSVAIAIIAVAIAALSTLTPEQLTPATAAISAVMGMFALMTKMSGNISSSIGTLAIMTGAVALIGYIIYQLAKMDTGNTLNIALGLAAVITAFGVSLKLIDGLGGISLKAVGTIAVMILVSGALGLLLAGLASLDVQPSIETSAAISILLIAMAAVCSMLVPLGAPGVGIAAIKGAGVLSVVVALLGAVILGMAKLVTMALPSMADDLSDFMTRLGPFIDGAAKIDEKMINGINALVSVMHAFASLAAAGLVDSITTLFTGSSSIDIFGEGVTSLAGHLKDFASNLDGFDESTLTSVEWASKIIETLAGAAESINGQSGWSKFIFGDNSLTTFVENLDGVIDEIKYFATNSTGITKETVDTVQNACDIITAISKAGSKIDGQSTIGKAIFGDNSLEKFVENLGTVGSKIKSFVKNVGKFDKETINTVECAGDAIVVLTEAASKINGQSEKSIEWFGDDSLSTFASKLPTIGTNLASFAKNLGTFAKDQVNSVKCAGDVIVALSEAGSKIDGQSDWAKNVFGDNGLGVFSTDLPTVATNLRGFVANLGNFTEDNITSVNNAVKVIKSFSDLGRINLGELITYLPSLGEYMIVFANDLVDFCTKICALDSTSVANITTSLVEMINGVASDITSNTEAFTQAGADIVDAIAKGLDNSKYTLNEKATTVVVNAADKVEGKKSKFKNAGKTLAESLGEGISEKEKTITTSVEEISKKGATAASSELVVKEFRIAGKDFADGLINGMESKHQEVYNAGYALGQKAVEGEKDGQKSNSPSKLTTKAGVWLGEGLVNGMVKMFGSVYNTGRDLGSEATNSISLAMSKIADTVNMNVDSQPTIRPVVDLSNVESGANAINNMFGMSPSVSALANVGTTSSMMNARNQNGINDDVVSAINKLDKHLDNVGGTSYNINGITYGGGSDVSNAIEALVRAIVIDGRV